MKRSRFLFSIVCLMMFALSMLSLTACGGKVNNFKLSFKVDGEVYQTITTTGNESIKIPENPAKTGYEFDGWFWDKDVWSKPFTANSLLDAPISSDMSVYAKFNAIEYDITYNLDGGTHDNPLSYTIEDSIVLSDAEKTGYSFVGWYSDSNYNTKVETISAGTTGDITLYAKFEIENYIITYINIKDVLNSNPTSYNVNSDTIILTNLSKDGYTFNGWYNGEEKVTEIAKGSTGNLTLEARWTVVDYEIVYHNVNGATNNNPENYNVEEQPLVLVDLEKAGYNFLGWFTDENFTSEITEISVGTTGEINLYANWEIIEYTATFMDGTTVVEEIKFTVETESIDEPAVPNHVGYNGEWEDYELALEDITIDAVYTAIEYTATFMDGTTVVEEVKFTVESESITEPTVPNHVGYNGKWEDYILGTEDITIDAVYTIVTYNIEYLNTKDLESENPETYTIESETIVLEDLSKEGYNFDGWYNNAGNKVEAIEKGSHGDLTLTARWTTLTYTITYLYDNAYGDVEEGENLKTSYTVEDEFTFEELVCKNEGFNFRGWFTEKNVGTGDKVLGVAKGTTGNFTVYAQFGLEVYDIIYNNVNGAINNNPTYYDIETEDFTIYPLSKEGYNFDGWFTNEEYTEEANLTIVKGSNGDITLYAKWTAITYIIEYVTYGGSFENNNYPESYTINDEISLVEPTLSNNFFVGWFTLAEGGKLQEKIEKGSTGNVTLYARWISFESNGGGKVEYKVSIEKNKFNEPVKINQPVAPEKNYYTFEGWYTDEELTNKFDFAIPSKNLVLYANWEATEYKINYVLNGGENAEENQETYTIEEKVIFADASKTGYDFVGWFTDEDFTSTVVKELPLGSHGEITLYAHYSINKYTISFETNGGTSVTAITQNYATEVVAPEAPAKNGYEFVGWYSNQELTRKYTFSTMPAENIMLYAKWNIVTYDIIYNLDGGKFVDNTYATTYRIDSEDIILKTPTKTGYNFAGWFTDAECTQAITEIKSGSYGSLEVFAKWTAITYTITYVMPDGTINNNATTYTIETDLTTLTNASVKGYDFIGWFADKDFTTAITTIGGGETGDKTIYGKFNPATYNVWLDGNEEAKAVVSFNLNGGEGSVTDQTITPTVTLKYPTNPTRTGYVFGGWYDNEICEGASFDFTAIVTKDITLYAKWVKVENATAIAINGSASITLNGKTEQMLMFVPLVSGNITITSSGSYDTFGVLYNENMMVLTQDDDTASDGINFHIVYNVTAGKTYYIGARAFSSTTTGSATVSISGNTAVPDGGYTITTTKASVTYGSHFTFNTPSAREGYKFLGYADEHGVMYTDSTGASVKVWDKDQDTTLYSVWEKMVYTVTFETSGGSPIDSIELAFGERLDIGQYVTTRTGYTFNGWYYNGVEYNATTMPDYNFTLTAYWKTFALGTIKYDTDKKAVSVNDEITASLFDAICLDTNGNLANFSVSISGKQEAGETITVRLVATSGNKTKQVTITGVKVYSMPTLTFNNTIDYVNVVGGLTASAFSASGTDTFGQATKIEVYIDGVYKVGSLVTVTIASIDPAGNTVYGYVENVKAYGLPEITYNQNKTAISINDTLSAELFNATAKDSFGENVVVNVTRYSGNISAGNTVIIRLSATDSKGNVTIIDVKCKVYGAPTITDSTVTEIKLSDDITAESLGISAVDTYGENLDITFIYNEKVAGEILTVTAKVTDIADNVTTKDFELKVYGIPTITYDRDAIKVTEDVTGFASRTISFDLNGGSGSIARQTVTDTVGLVYPTIPTRSGYAFGGWYADSSCSGNPYDFSAEVNKNITLYAKWVSMTSSSYSREYVDIAKYNSSSNRKTVSITATSSSSQNYYYFTCYEAGSYTFYASYTSGDFYVYVYNATKGSTILNKYNLYSSKPSISAIFTADAGDVIYVSLYKYSGSSSTGSGYFYVSGAKYPVAGGVASGDASETILNIVAKDSFENKLSVTATIKLGSLTAGTNVIYTLTAIDHLGNVATLDTKEIGVYDVNDIELEYSAGMSDLIKLSSKGEEFNAKATDSFGNACDITIEPAESYTLAGGNIISLYIVATDKAGNKVYSDLIENVKVYDVPIYIINGVLYEDTDLNFFITVKDSFDEELVTEFTYVGKQKENEIITFTIKAVDDAGNELNITIPMTVIPKGLVLTLNGNEYSVTKYTGTADSIVLLDSYDGKPLTKISNSAFENCTSLTSIEIPNSVTSIGSYAFSGCTAEIIWGDNPSITEIGSYAFSGYKGTSIEIPNSVISIGSYAFYNCSGLENITLPFIGASLNGTTNTHLGYIFGARYNSENDDYVPSSLKTVKITGSGSIDERAFYDCDSLELIEIPDSVASIGEEAFNGCGSLTKVNYTGTIDQWVEIKFSDFSANPLYYANKLYINDKLVTEANITTAAKINDYAFCNCNSLTSVTIGNSVTSIGSYVFYISLFNSSSLISVTIGNSVTSIGTETFYDCDSLELIEIPNSVTSIGKNTFYNCSSLTKVNYLGEIDDWAQIEFGDIKATPFYFSAKLYINEKLVTEANITTATKINDYAFYSCDSLKSVTIGNSVTSIGEEAFKFCNSLTSVIIGNGVKSVDKYAFYYCDSLTSVTVGNSVTSIGFDAFYYCSPLKVNYTGTIDGWAQIEFGNYYANPLHNAEKLHINDQLVTEANITTATKINDYAFYNCSSITSVTIGSSVKSIGSDAFEYCSSLIKANYLGTMDGWAQIEFGNYYANPLYYAKKLHINDQLVTEANITTATKINDYAFYNCSSITSVTIGGGVTSIGNSAFYSCSSLTSIVVGNSVTSIGSFAFYGCSSLDSITLPFVGISRGCSNNTHFGYIFGADSKSSNANYVPSSLKTVVIIGSGSIDDYAFHSCSSLTSVTIGGSVTSIESSAFYGCSSLENVTIGDSVTSIGNYVFEECSSLVNIKFSDTSTWYRTTDWTDWYNKTGGTQTSVTSSSYNVTYFKTSYDSYNWYKI